MPAEDSNWGLQFPIRLIPFHGGDAFPFQPNPPELAHLWNCYSNYQSIAKYNTDSNRRQNVEIIKIAAGLQARPRSQTNISDESFQYCCQGQHMTCLCNYQNQKPLFFFFLNQNLIAFMLFLVWNRRDGSFIRVFFNLLPKSWLRGLNCITIHISFTTKLSHLSFGT